MRFFISVVISLLLIMPASAATVVSNLENKGITQSDFNRITGGQFALGFITNDQAWLLESVTMRLDGGNYAIPAAATIPVKLYTSVWNGFFEEPGALIGNLGELSIETKSEYTAMAPGPLELPTFSPSALLNF